MNCPKCNKPNEDGAVFCQECGTKLNAPETEKTVETTAAPKTAEPNRKWILPVVIAASAFFVVLAIIVSTFAILHNLRVVREEYSIVEEKRVEEDKEDEEDPFEENVKKREKKPAADREVEKIEAQSLERAKMVEGDGDQYCDTSLEPSVPGYMVSQDLSDIVNQDDIEYLQDDARMKLARNQFVVMDDCGDEFFDVYEMNRYSLTPNFVTVDSMMHTYHIYFSYLLKKIEKEDLYQELSDLTDEMYNASLDQYDELQGTEWEEAALRNVAFFTVGKKLLGDDVKVISGAEELVDSELANIKAGEIGTSPLLGDYEDYSQYKPRGYYDGDETLEKYFKAMMWYGRRAFEQREEDHMRSALLMTLAMKEGKALDKWEAIYTVTSFFAGASDDNTYYEFEPAVEAAYGNIDDVSSLIGDDEGFLKFYEYTKDLKAPAINSIPVWETDEENVIPSFRFMGQRFSIDATIFQNLIYRSVEENGDDEKRYLPDALDVPAALGSEAAYNILDKMGETKYKNYPEKMEELRKGIEEREGTDLWTASLYAQWLNTLRPLLQEKGEGYPAFMQTDEWTTKSLEGFLGSYAELKHDTILYSKQAMAEMGGGWDEEKDDRGYVEPEPKVYSRFATLAESTMEGLKRYNMLDKDDRENLQHLADLAKKLVTISEKELVNETLTDEEYDLIREYGGDIEHIWADATREDEDDWPRSDEHPGAIIADVATDPNGSVLEIGTGRVGKIFVVCLVDGKLKACVGSVYSFYEFPWPLSDRLTDNEWRVKLGIWPESGYDFKQDESIKQPAWTGSYRSRYVWDY